ncbi:MAG: hypothetical protein V7642_4797 [Burkholderiales bacterium]|jgi:hypothetical protein
MATNSVTKKPVARGGSAQAKKSPVTARPKAPAAKSLDKKASAKPAAKQPQAKAKPEPVEQKEKVKKPKVVRDSFTMPEAEYKLLGEVKRDCLKAGIEVKKSELLRAGVALIRKMDINQIKTVLSALQPLKAGRPKKEK